jgi:hypothetical protein
MITKTENPQIPVAALDGTEPLTPEQFVEQLRMLRQHVPDFGPLPKASANLLRSAARTSAEFIQASINTVGTSKAIASAISSDRVALLGERTEAGRWSAVEDELRTLLAGVAAANLSRHHRIGLAALQVYSIARQLVRRKENADLLPHVDNMRRTNLFGRRRPAAPDAQAPEPASPPVTSPVKP